MSVMARFRVSAALLESSLGTGSEHDISVGADEGFTFTFDVPDATTEQSLIAIGAAGGIETVTALKITTDTTIGITLGAAGSNVAFQLNANGVLVLAATSLTAIAVSNSSGATAKVSGMMVGT